MASGVILPNREVPFSLANFQALRVGAPLRDEGQSLVLLEQGGESVHRDREHAKLLRTREYEGRCNDAFRFWQWVALALAMLFIASVVITIGIICIRLNETFDVVQSLGDTGTGKGSSMTQIVNHALQSAENVNLATQNMARATLLAHTTAAMAAPQLQRAMNETVGIVDDLRSFSFHPQWTVSTGGIVPNGRRTR